MYICCALLPIVLALVLMTKFRVSPGKALPVSLILSLENAAGTDWRGNPARHSQSR